MPFLYARPERFRIGTAPPIDTACQPGRFTVDTSEDLAFARAIAARHRAPGPGRARRTLARDRRATSPTLLELNRDVRQKPWQEAER